MNRTANERTPGDPGGTPDRGRVERFVRTWFDLLSDHRPAGELLPLVVDDGLEMAFPERTLHGHADFLDWYRVVGESFSDQTHTVEDVAATPVPDEPGALHVDVTVVWRAEQASDGTRIAARARQEWLLVPAGTGEPAARPAAGGGLAIRRYRVLGLDPV